MDNFQVGAVTPFQDVQQQGCCCERTGGLFTASPEKVLLHPLWHGLFSAWGRSRLRRKKVHFPPILTQLTPTPGGNGTQIRYS